MRERNSYLLSLGDGSATRSRPTSLFIPSLLLLGACAVDPGTTMITVGETGTDSGTDATATDTSDSGDGDSDSTDTSSTDSTDTTTTTDDGTDTTDSGNAFCGDSVIEGFEVCDCGADGECTDEELDMMDCTTVTDPVSGNFFDGGVLTCNMSCQWDTSGCFVCGDGFLTDTETCDGDQFGTNTCGSAGFLGGELACTDTCELDTTNCTEATWFDGFEETEIDLMTWGFMGNDTWHIDTVEANGGSQSARSGNAGTSGSSSIILDMTWAADGTIAFAHKHDSEGTLDKLQFFVDDIQQGTNWGGQADWVDDAFPITAGTHRLEWRYSKDGSVDTGADAAWIDNVRSDGAVAVATCGDAFLSTSEVCDGNLLGLNTCFNQGFLGGTLACDGSCQLDTSACTNPSWTEDWETGAIDSASWGSAGAAGWVIDGTGGNGGSANSAHSGMIPDASTSDLFLDMTWAQAGAVAFSYKTDSDMYTDELQFLIDDVEQDAWAGTGGAWTQVNYPVTAGTHRLTWRYNKDTSFTSGSDRVWIDDILTDGTVAVPTCGDNWLSSSEACDGSDLGSATCESEGFLGGTLACDGSCQLDTSGCVQANFTEGWESSTISQPPWADGGDSAWSISSVQYIEGTKSVRSGVVGDNQSTDLVLTLDFAQPGVMNFQHRENTAAGDKLLFLIDDVEQGAGWEGVNTWAAESFPVTTAGSHTFIWRYQKDGTGSTVSDRVWIDDIRSSGSAQ